MTNIWIPDGYKDIPVDRKGPRERLTEVARRDLRRADRPASTTCDAVEGKLFGIGSESYVVGSHEFYLGYAVTNKTLLCLDAGPLPPDRGRSPTRSRPCCPSSTRSCCTSAAACAGTATTWSSSPTSCRPSPQEIVRGDYLDRVHIGLDFFDASINRVAAWVIGTRNMLKALLLALLEPTAKLQQLEAAGRLHLAPGAAGGDSRRCPSAPCGITTARSRTCRSATPG